MGKKQQKIQQQQSPLPQQQQQQKKQEKTAAAASEKKKSKKTKEAKEIIEEKRKEEEEEEKMAEEEEVEEEIAEEETPVQDENDGEILPKNFVARLDKKHNVAQKFFITAGAIIVVPFVVIFTIYQVLINPYTMKDPLPKDVAITYAGVAGIVVTILIQVGYMVMAINEGKDDDKEKEKQE